MTDTLRWLISGVSFEDGSKLADWKPVEKSDVWHWQYDTHELSFTIYEHDGQYWKLYHARMVPKGETEFVYDFGGLACRMVKVEYHCRARSPHSNMPKDKAEQEWIRTYEYDEQIHRVVLAGEENDRYGRPYGNTKQQHRTVA